METSTETTQSSLKNLHTPGVYQGSPDTPTDTPPAELSPIRTMKNDIAWAVKNKNETLASMAQAEDKKKTEEQVRMAAEKEAVALVIPPVAPRPIGRMVIIVALVLFLTLTGLAYSFLLPKLRTVTIPKIPTPSFGAPTETAPSPSPQALPVTLAPSLVPAQTEKHFLTNKETPEHMFSVIASERTKKRETGNIENFYFSESVSTSDGNQKTVSISANRLLMLAEARAPEILTRSLENIFMAGLLSEQTSTVPTPFLILRVSGYDTGFAGMLEWEQSLPHFFDTIFGTNIEAGLSEKTKMRDMVLAGHDARVMEIAPNVGIAYTFANPSTIVIAGSRTALEKIMSLLGK